MVEVIVEHDKFPAENTPIIINTNKIYLSSGLIYMRYMLRSVRFEIPDLWKDESMYIYKYNMQGSPITLVVSPDKIERGETPNSYVERQLDILSKRLASFSLLKKERIRDSGTTIVYDLIFTWQSQVGNIRQLQRYVISGDQILTFTISIKKDDFTKFQGVINEILSKISLTATT